jgi:ribonuclease HI
MTLYAVHSVNDLVALGLPSAKAALFLSLPKPAEGDDALVYCDGACSGNGVKVISPGGWGAVVIRSDGSVTVGYGSSPHTTNNKMELSAAIESLKAIPKGAKAVAFTDSQYVIKGCTEWRAGWVRKGMKNSKGDPVANPELWEALWGEVDVRRVSFKWVKGHNGDAGNEIADALALLGSEQAAVPA